MTKPTKKKFDLNAPKTDQLSAEEIAATKVKARKEHDEEVKAKQISDLLAYEKQELLRAGDPDEEQIFLRVVLPEFCDRVWIDGVIYLHGWHGHVSKSRFMSMQDAIARAWDHKLDTEGKKYPNRRPMRDIMLSGYAGDAAVSAHSLLERRAI